MTGLVGTIAVLAGATAAVRLLSPWSLAAVLVWLGVLGFVWLLLVGASRNAPG